MEREDEEREDSLLSKLKKDQKVKPIKKKSQPNREITQYFFKINKQVVLNRNIPTPDKAALEQIDRHLTALHDQEQQLLVLLQEAKIKTERQKEERETYLAKSRALVCSQLKKIAEINRFFKRQSHHQLKQKQHLLNQTQQDLKRKKEQMTGQNLTNFQQYFIQKNIQKIEKELELLFMDVFLLSENNRIAQEEQGCFFAKEGWPQLMKRYQPLELIGKGGFSQVYRSYDLYSNQTVAIKLSSVEHLLQGCGNKHEYLRHIKRQYQIHKSLDHPNIVKLIEVVQLESAICIVLEYCEGSTLAQYLKTQGTLCEVEAKMIILQIAKVIQYLSSQDPAIIHYDLKPQNIIFNKGELKVLDFGICKTMDSEHSKMALTSQGIGTCCYLPPETLIPHNPVISNKVDVWSLGIIFYQLIKGSRPFGSNLLYASYLNGGHLDQKNLFSDDTNLGEQCQAFIMQCLQIDESKRLNPLTILNHPYLSKDM